MRFVSPLSKWFAGPSHRPAAGAFRPGVEALESRLVPYNLSGNAWPHPELITISFVPDGTNLNGYASNLFTQFNAKFGAEDVWQTEILKAAQQWAQRTNINFAVVPDNGAPLGSGSYQQGDPNFGDIRIGGYFFGNSTLAQAYLPPPVNNYSIAGDFQLNTGQTFNIGSTYDLFTVSMHEFGHALGLYHGAAKSVMYSAFGGTMTGLVADDIDGIQDIYSNDKGRSADAYDARARNESFDTASAIGGQITTKKTALINNLDLSNSADEDYYKFATPSGCATSLTVTVQSRGQSLLAPRLQIYNGSQKLLATVNGANQYGTTLTATVDGLATGKVYYIRVSSTDPYLPFESGRYSLALNLGTGDDPAVAAADTRTAEGQPLSGGGGAAVKVAYETLVNTSAAGAQQTATTGHKAVATDLLGNYVVTWASQDADGTGWNIYARRYNVSGQAQGDAFRVNSTTIGDQVDPTVAMDPLGNFVIAWTGYSADGSDANIYAKRYTLLGIPLLGEFRVNGTTAGDQTAASVATDDLGNFVITWTSTTSNGSDVYARLYLVAGLSLLGEFRVNTTTAGDQADSSIVMNRLTGDFTITWASKGQDALGSWGVYARQYSLLGLAKGGEFRVNSTTAGDQLDPSIAINRFTGEFTVTWSSNGQDAAGSWGIYGRRYGGNGAALDGEFLVNTTTAGDQTSSSAAMDSGGNLFVTWSSLDLDGASAGVFGQQFTQSGQRLEEEFVINGTTTGDQVNASLAIDNLGQVVVVWSGNGEADDSGIYFQRFSLATAAAEPDEQGNAAPSDGSPGHPLPPSQGTEGGGPGGNPGRPLHGWFRSLVGNRNGDEKRGAEQTAEGSTGSGTSPADAPPGAGVPGAAFGRWSSRRHGSSPAAPRVLDSVFDDTTWLW